MELYGYGTSPPPLDRHLDATFAALADPTRRAILARLAAGAASVTELAAPFDLTQPAISKHLKVLERAGLISRGRDAQRRPRRLEAQPLAAASEWLERYRQFWDASFQRLDALLEEIQREAPPASSNPGPSASPAPSPAASAAPGSGPVPTSIHPGERTRRSRRDHR